MRDKRNRKQHSTTERFQTFYDRKNGRVRVTVLCLCFFPLNLLQKGSTLAHRVRVRGGGHWLCISHARTSSGFSWRCTRFAGVGRVTCIHSHAHTRQNKSLRFPYGMFVWNLLQQALAELQVQRISRAIPCIASYITTHTVPVGCCCCPRRSQMWWGWSVLPRSLRQASIFIIWRKHAVAFRAACATAENFMTSKQLDEFGCNGRGCRAPPNCRSWKRNASKLEPVGRDCLAFGCQGLGWKELVLKGPAWGLPLADGVRSQSARDRFQVIVLPLSALFLIYIILAWLTWFSLTGIRKLINGEIG